MEEERSDEQPGDPSGQLALMPELARARAREAKARTAPPAPAPVDPAPERPVARVLVDVPLAHLDRPFDYLVPALLHEQVRARRPGSRSGSPARTCDGFVLERADRSEHDGSAGAAAPGGQRRAGAVPGRRPALRPGRRPLRRHPLRRAPAGRPAAARHHREAADSVPAPEAAVDLGAAEQAWSEYGTGASFVRRLAAGEAPRAVWSALPGDDWPALLAQAAAATARRRARRRWCACRTARTSARSTPR